MTSGRLLIKRGLAWLCWAVWLLVLVFPILPAADTWWHLASGRYLLENGWLPAPQDPFTFGDGIDAWLNHQWLCQIMFYKIYAASGLNGLYILRSAVLLLAFAGLPLLLNRRKGGDALTAAWGILGFVCLAQGAYFFDARCYICTYLLLSASLYILSRYLETADLRALALLPFLAALGSNLHGGFGILLAVQGVCAFACSLTKERRRTAGNLWAAFAASIGLTVLLNPYHLGILTFPFSLLEPSAFKVGLNEWQRPQIGQMGLLALLTALLVWQRSRLGLPQLLLGAFFILLGMTAWRHAPLAALAAIYLWIDSVPEQSVFRTELSRGLRRLLGVLFYAAAFVMLTLGAYQLGHRWIGGAQHWTMTCGMFPGEAVNFLAVNPRLPRDIYNPYEWGGFLEFYSYPRVRCFQDGRAHTVFSERRYAEGLYAEYGQPWREVLRQHQMEHLLADTPDFYSVFDKYNIDLVLSSRILGSLSERMRRLPQWSLIYSDEVCDIYVRKIRLASQNGAPFVYPLTARECCRRAEDCFQKGSFHDAYLWGCQAAAMDKADQRGYLIAAAAAWQENRAWEGVKYSAGAFLIDCSSPVLWYNLSAWAERSGHAGTARCIRRLAGLPAPSVRQER